MRYVINWQRNVLHLVAQDIQVVMEGVPNLLYLKCRTWSRQISPTEMRLAECQVQKNPVALSQNPTYASAGEPRP